MRIRTSWHSLLWKLILVSETVMRTEGWVQLIHSNLKVVVRTEKVHHSRLMTKIIREDEEWVREDWSKNILNLHFKAFVWQCVFKIHVILKSMLVFIDYSFHSISGLFSPILPRCFFRTKQLLIKLIFPNSPR